MLREEQEVILTVLEVFKYDPLHSWYVFSSLFASSVLTRHQDCERDEA